MFQEAQQMGAENWKVEVQLDEDHLPVDLDVDV